MSIPDDDSVENLGKKLGFKGGEINSFLKSNHKFGNVTSRGTLAMLRKWKMRVRQREERTKLRQALTDANMVRLAEDICGFSSICSSVVKYIMTAIEY